MANDEANPGSSTATVSGDEAQTTISGRSVFIVETTQAGVAVQTSFMTDDGKFLQMPAIFPDVQYALAQIDELRQLVLQHFSQAAKVGAQVMAAQAQQVTKAEEQKNADSVLNVH
jgi:hypothetical protein